MLANPYTKFTPFEKKALCAFGCIDKEITLNNLDAVATMAHHKETAARFDRLISKADQESDHPSPDKCINISITTDQLVRLVNGIRETKRKKG